jgi:hypothetical protein
VNDFGLISTTAVGGGIVQMPDHLPAAEQPMGAGMTVYYFVDSIEKVNAVS